MEALAVKQFFNCLSDALSLEHPGVFFFSEKQLDMLSEIVPVPAQSTPRHDIAYLVYRLKQNVLGMPDPVDGKITREPEKLIPFACELLAMRWDVIKNTAEDYTRCSVMQNQIALAFVKQLANFSLKLSDHEPRLKFSIQRWMKVFSTDGQKTEFNIYALLIPTLTQQLDPISKDIISNSHLHCFILSDDGRSLFSLKNSQDSFDRGDGFFNIDVVPSRLFTESEKERIRQKPLVLRPAAMVRTDFIVTRSYPGPRVTRATEIAIKKMLARAVAIATDPALNFAAFKQKYTIENQSLSQQDIDCLVDIHLDKFRDDERIRLRSQKVACIGYDLVLMSELPNSDENQAEAGKIYLSSEYGGKYIVRDISGNIQQGTLEGVDLTQLLQTISTSEFKKTILEIASKAGHTPCIDVIDEARRLEEARRQEEARRLELEIERKRLKFRASLDTSGKAQSDNTLSFLALKARHNAIAAITAEMLVYCHVLEQERPDEYTRLMNQVFDDGSTQPKTFSYVLSYIPSAIDCSSVALLTNLTKIFKPGQQDSMPMPDAKEPAKSTAIPIPGGAGIFSLFYSSSQLEDPISVASKMAYSPERGNGFI
jgi:hypothetical protein